MSIVPRPVGLTALRRWWSLAPALVAFFVYYVTLAPDLTWGHDGADGGDLLAAALTRGIPHPSGYPTYILLLRTWLVLPLGSPAFAGNLFSAVSASLTVGCLAAMTGRVLRSALAPLALTRLLASATALTIGFGPTLWSQAVITEVYALHALSAAILFYLAMWIGDAGDVPARVACLVGMALGLGLGNHLTLALLIPAMALGWRMARARVNRRAAAGLALGCSVGLVTYLYLPWAAAGSPPINWGNPRSLAQIGWHLSGAIYQPLAFALPLAWLPQRLLAWGGLLVHNLTWLGAGLAWLGLWRCWEEQRWWSRMTLAAVLLVSGYALGYDSADSYVYLLPVYLALAPAFALGAWTIVEELGRRAGRFGDLPSRAATLTMLAALALLPLYQLQAHWTAQDLSQDEEAPRFIATVLATAAPDALILVAGDRPTFALWYARYGLHQRPDLAIVNVHLYTFAWYRETIARWHSGLTPHGARAMPDDLNQMIEDSLRVRPVYAVEWPLAGLERFGALREGSLFRLQLSTTEFES